jgi:hypothetical protein
MTGIGFSSEGSFLVSLLLILLWIGGPALVFATLCHFLFPRWSKEVQVMVSGIAGLAAVPIFAALSVSNDGPSFAMVLVIGLVLLLFLLPVTLLVAALTIYLLRRFQDS